MHKAHFVAAERVSDIFKSLLERFQLELLVFLDKRIHDVCLSADRQFVADEPVHPLAVVLVAQYGLYRLASGRQFVDYRHVEVAVDGHGKRARDRRGCHHKHVRRIEVFLPQTGALRHAEAVLLVDNHQPEASERPTVVLNHGVCADENVYGAVGQSGVYLVAFFSFLWNR